MQFYPKGSIQLGMEGYDKYSTGFDVDEYMEGRTKFSDILDDIKNEDPQTMKQLQKASEEVRQKELGINEVSFNKGLDKQFNNILKEKNIEKLYAFVVLYNSENLLINRKINELLFFTLTKEELKNNSKIIKKILKILNK